jgi:N-acetyl-anhydromuramyl-L-alanine amidase AmpD
MDRPPSTWTPSPNFRACAPGRPITCVVIHATATAGADSPRAWLCDPKSQVSAHYLIDPAGAIWHLVHEQDIAWHCNPSIWRGQTGVNAFSVGIELVNPNDGATPYPQAQLEACADLAAAICLEHGIRLEDVVGHVDVVHGATPEETARLLRDHSDPKGLPWDVFRALLRARGVPA